MRSTVLVLACVCGISCTSAVQWGLGGFSLTWDGLSLTVKDVAVGNTVWSSAQVPFVSFSGNVFSASQVDGNFDVSDVPICTSNHQTVTSASLENSKVVIRGNLHSAAALCAAHTAEYQMTIRVSPLSSKQLEIAISVSPADHWQEEISRLYPLNRSAITTVVRLDTLATIREKVFGFGVQYSIWDCRGRVVPMIVSEQGVGRGLEPLTALLNIAENGAGGNWHTTYAPVPHYITTNMQSFYLHNTEYATFDLTAQDKHIISVYSGTLHASIVSGSTPMDHIKEYTLHAGRQPQLPEWVTEGPIVGYEGGTEAVLALHQRLSAMNITPAAYWLQDWSGLRVDSFGKRLWWNWEVDDFHYPSWDTLCKTLARDGTRILTYINPYLANTVSAQKPNFDRDLFKEAATLGFLVLNKEGTPYIQASGSSNFTFGTVDFTNPEAAQWYQTVMQKNMMQRQISGWMSDFGEYLPFDAVLFNGSAAVLHNKFPQLWAKVNYDATKIVALGDDSSSEIVYFSRSGAAQSPGSSPLFWLGDQLTSWDAFDGLHSTLLARITGGLSGFTSSHTDIGGYTMINRLGLSYTRGKELLLRWMELSALADSVFRTHPGNLPNASWQIYSDNSTLECFARMAALHKISAPYRRALALKAGTTGAPIIRPMWLHFPDDENATNQIQQFMVGPDLIVAPVLYPGETTVSVYVPVGGWSYLWDGRSKGLPLKASEEVLPAPFGKPAVLFRQGSQIGVSLRNALPSVEMWPCQGV